MNLFSPHPVRPVVANPEDYSHCPYDQHAIGVSHLRMPKAEFIKALERKNPQRVPCWFNWLSHEFFILHPEELTLLQRQNPNDFIMVMPARSAEWRPDERGANEFGVWSTSVKDGVGGPRAGSYLEDWSQLDHYIKNYIPKAGAPGRMEHVARIVADNPDVYIMGHWAYGPYEQMHAIRGMEQLMVDLHQNRREVLRLGDALMEYWIGLIDLFASAGVDGIFFTDDWGSQDRLMISPRMWREIFRPWYQRLVDRAHSHGLHVMLHSCGNIRAIIPDLIEVGFDALNPLQPTAMDAETIAAEFKGKITFCGGVDVQYFIVNNTPEQVETGIRRLIEIFDGPEGGFIIAPANSIMPETPLENVQAMARAMRTYGVRNPGRYR
jgi:uroporphyrinogen decarboxylase